MRKEDTQPGKTHLFAGDINRLTDYLVTAGTANTAAPVAVNINKTPSANSPHRGLSLEFIEKYDLSDRQADVTEVLLKGKSDKEIAAFLGIAPNTVQTHLKKVYRKTGAGGRYALMALVGLGGNK
jgi:DNA-binding CsgD family transcriptional regulator